MCKQRGGRLNADHIEPLSKLIFENNILSVKQALKCDELWQTENGMTLCEKCHQETETYGGNSRQN